MPDETYVPDFFDRDGARLRCRPCGAVIDYADPGLDAAYLDDHVGEAIGCPACGLASRIPTAEESEWPKRKDPGDPASEVPVVERAVANASNLAVGGHDAALDGEEALDGDTDEAD